MRKLQFGLMALLMNASIWASAASDIVVSEAWVRWVPPVSEGSAAYFNLQNQGAKDRVLVSVTADIAKTVEMHKVVSGHGVSKMIPVEYFQVAGAGKLELEPGGRHLMLIGLKKPLQEEDTVNMTLEFDDGEKVTVPFSVKREKVDDAHHEHHKH